MAKPAAVDLSGYVNLHGQPVTRTASHVRRTRPKQAAVQMPADASPAGKHMGWHAVGFSPEQIAKARAEKGVEFDEVAYMNAAQPKRARPTPYSVASSAQQCAEMLARAGWKRVAVVEVIKK